VEVAAGRIPVNDLLYIGTEKSILPLKSFLINLAKSFKMILHAPVIIGSLRVPGTVDSGERISLYKPNPFMLNLIPSLIGKAFRGCYYLGDMLDDMQAARSSQTGYRVVEVVVSSADPENLRKELLQAGADHIVDDYQGLPGIID
jgi:hypothetical protein